MFQNVFHCNYASNQTKGKRYGRISPHSLSYWDIIRDIKIYILFKAGVVHAAIYAIVSVDCL